MFGAKANRLSYAALYAYTIGVEAKTTYHCGIKALISMISRSLFELLIYTTFS
jgi:hypothetical protein